MSNFFNSEFYIEGLDFPGYEIWGALHAINVLTHSQPSDEHVAIMDLDHAHAWLCAHGQTKIAETIKEAVYAPYQCQRKYEEHGRAYRDRTKTQGELPRSEELAAEHEQTNLYGNILIAIIRALSPPSSCGHFATSRRNSIHELRESALPFLHSDLEELKNVARRCYQGVGLLLKAICEDQRDTARSSLNLFSNSQLMRLGELLEKVGHKVRSSDGTRVATPVVPLPGGYQSLGTQPSYTEAAFHTANYVRMAWLSLAGRTNYLPSAPDLTDDEFANVWPEARTSFTSAATPEHWTQFVRFADLVDDEIRDARQRIDRAIHGAQRHADGGGAIGPNDARNRFCYEQWEAGRTLKEIWVDVKDHAEWEQVSEPAAVRGPINSWASKNGLIVTKRHPGRRSPNAK